MLKARQKTEPTKYIDQYVVFDIQTAAGPFQYTFSNYDVRADVEYTDGMGTEVFTSETGEPTSVPFTGVRKLKITALRFFDHDAAEKVFQLRKHTQGAYSCTVSVVVFHSHRDGLPDVDSNPTGSGDFESGYVEFTNAVLELDTEEPAIKNARGIGIVKDQTVITAYEVRCAYTYPDAAPFVNIVLVDDGSNGYNISVVLRQGNATDPIDSGDGVELRIKDKETGTVLETLTGTYSAAINAFTSAVTPGLSGDFSGYVSAVPYLPATSIIDGATFNYDDQGHAVASGLTNWTGKELTWEIRAEHSSVWSDWASGNAGFQVVKNNYTSPNRISVADGTYIAFIGATTGQIRLVMINEINGFPVVQELITGFNQDVSLDCKQDGGNIIIYAGEGDPTNVYIKKIVLSSYQDNSPLIFSNTTLSTQAKATTTETIFSLSIYPEILSGTDTLVACEQSNTSTHHIYLYRWNGSSFDKTDLYPFLTTALGAAYASGNVNAKHIKVDENGNLYIVLHDQAGKCAIVRGNRVGANPITGSSGWSWQLVGGDITSISTSPPADGIGTAGEMHTIGDITLGPDVDGDAVIYSTETNFHTVRRHMPNFINSPNLEDTYTHETIYGSGVSGATSGNGTDEPSFSFPLGITFYNNILMVGSTLSHVIARIDTTTGDITADYTGVANTAGSNDTILH